MKNHKGKTTASFTQFERVCEAHVQEDDKVCYCGDTGNRCNKANCPEFGHKIEEDEEGW